MPTPEDLVYRRPRLNIGRIIAVFVAFMAWKAYNFAQVIEADLKQGYRPAWAVVDKPTRKYDVLKMEYNTMVVCPVEKRENVGALKGLATSKAFQACLSPDLYARKAMRGEDECFAFLDDSSAAAFTECLAGNGASATTVDGTTAPTNTPREPLTRWSAKFVKDI